MSILSCLASGLLGLRYEGVSSYLNIKGEGAVKKANIAIRSHQNLQWN